MFYFMMSIICMIILFLYVLHEWLNKGKGD